MASSVSPQPPSEPVVAIRVDGRTSHVPLSDYLAPDRAEDAERLGNLWIKSLRHVPVEGRTLRDRFTYRGDSLWWFTELYLHKQRTAARTIAAAFALDALMDRESPDSIEAVTGDRIVRLLAPQVAASRGVPCGQSTRDGATGRWRRSLTAGLTARLYAGGPVLARLRRGRKRAAESQADVAVFVHSAFWKEAAGDDTYVGPVLRALAARAAPGSLRFIGVGPSTTHRARTWRRRLGDFRDAHQAPGTLTPVEALAPLDALEGSREIWRGRTAVTRALLASDGLRAAAATMARYDVWPLIGDDLTGVAMLQFPWSARAMDEAAAALDALRPRIVVTYAEAGGWGRALVLEARRRGIPSVGIQHGFISRHWLNYLHEDDEIAPSPGNPSDQGCPLADLTLVYDEFARRHLLTAGRYPPERLRVSGNPRLDALVAQARALTPGELRKARRDAGARDDQHLVLLAAKRIPEFDATFGALMRAVADMPDVHLAVRPHPAETPEPYERLAAGIRNVRVVPVSLSAVALIAAARLVATINSTVAIEAMALEVPALAMRLPNYLSPFVEAGAMAGTSRPDEIGPAVARLVHDEPERARLAAGRRAFFGEHGIGADGHAAERAAEAILEFAT